ncbi:MAG: glycosyltransferase family 4 protein [Candidatus Acidiferrales bacterium]
MARVLYVSDGYSTHDRRFLDRLAESEHDMWYLPCAADLVRHENRGLPDGIHPLAPLSEKNILPGTASWVRAASRFRRVIRKVQPDLIHAGPVQTGGFFAAAFGFHPLLIMSWGSDVLTAPDKSAGMHWITKFVLRRADMALADCDAVREQISSLSPLTDDCIVSFPWGIDSDVFCPKISEIELRRKLGWERCQVIVSTRAFELTHGTMIFLDAMKRVVARGSHVRVLMLGDGSLRTRVESFVESNCLRDKIHVAGQVPEELLADYFAEADLYVSATCCDGSSISLLQAMGCGLPAIVADRYGNREWVVHKENGWLYPAGNPEALAAATLEALDQSQLRAAMGRANVAIVRARANWGLNFGKLLAAYDKLLLGRAAQEMERYAQLPNW